MAKQPAFLSLDQQSIDPRVLVSPASIAIPRTIDVRQHALMTEWGGAPYGADFHLETGSSGVSRVVPIRVPPGCYAVDLGALIYGRGDFYFSTAVDGVGTALRSRSETTGFEFADTVWTSGWQDAAIGALSARAIQVLSAVQWTWADVELTVVTQNVSTGVGITGLVVSPIFFPA